MNKNLLSLPVLLAVLAAGCGTEKIDVSGGVENLNSQFAGSGVSIDCPKEIEGGEGTEFDCTLKAAGTSEKVKLKVVKEEGELKVGAANQAEFDKAVEKVAGQ